MAELLTAKGLKAGYGLANVLHGIDVVIGKASTFDVVGFSFGGTMAACVGALAGKRARSVTIIGSAGVGAQGNLVIGDSPEEFAGYIRREADKWSAVVKKAGIRID